MRISPDHLDVVAAQTFGRQEAMFQGLLSFMASLSLILWSLVLLTAVVRFYACRVLYRPRRAPAVIPTVIPTSARTVLDSPAPAVLAATTDAGLTSRAAEESSRYVA